MKKVFRIFNKKVWIYYVIAALLVLPALWINLGLNTLTTDEPIRGIVTLEMMISSDYTSPSMYGEPYLKKPPLYNWILAGAFSIFNSYSEFVMRFPTTIFLLVFCLTIFLFLRKEYGNRFAFLNALMFLTCGRILIWDSMLALIDIIFSWVVYMNFMVIYRFNKNKKYWQLFIVSYLLMAIAYMFKGLPAVVFQGITLLVLFVSVKKYKKLFSIQHLLGILLFIGIVGGYYLLYFRSNNLSVDQVFSTLFGETTRRTVFRFGWGRTIGHFFTFHPEMLYHFAPWSLLIIALFRKGIIKDFWKHDLVKYSVLVFFANIFVYWTSPEVHPRYILMLAPLSFFVFLFYFEKYKDHNTIHNKIIEIVFGILVTIVPVLFLVFPFLSEFEFIEQRFIKSLSIALFSIILVFLYWRIKPNRLIIFGLVLLVFRIGFNWFILPHRNENSYASECRDAAIEVGKITKGSDLYSYNSFSIDDHAIFYISRQRMKIFKLDKPPVDTNAYYTSHKAYLEDVEYTKLCEFPTVWDHTVLEVVKFKKENP
jgi:4-amino-4-deoxy-L-arabinose transferase-like glycosyltransferase